MQGLSIAVGAGGMQPAIGTLLVLAALLQHPWVQGRELGASLGRCHLLQLSP